MKIKKSNLEWYVLLYDFNKKKIINYNVMNGIAELISKKIKNGTIYNKETLKEFLKKEYMYRYWSKAEYEILVSGLHNNANDDMEKIDIWRQLEMNLDRIVDYINIECDLKFK